MPPRFRELKSYCDKNGWVLVGDTDHWYYEKALPNGDILKTKVSHAVHKGFPGRTWEHILKKQLRTRLDEFNRNK